MKRIGHTRIDDRLIHGQIVASWIQSLGCRTIVVADDEAAGDSLQLMLLELAVPPGIELKVLSIADAAAFITGDKADNAKVLLILRGVESALALIRQGVKMDEINVGNVSANAQRTKYSKSIFLDSQDVAHFKELAAAGIHLEVRVVPGEKAVDLLSMIK